jgi:hypothetical protein
MWQAIGWTFTAAAVALTAARYVVRLRVLGGLQLDDLLHGCALATTIAFMGLLTAALQQNYASLADEAYYQRVGLAATWTGFVGVMYLVKFTFLALYRKVFQVSTSFMLAWKVVFVFTGLCFAAAFLSIFWMCGSPFQTVNPGEFGPYHSTYCSPR